MLFNTIDFVVFFIIVLTTITILKNKNFQHFFLLAASYFFFFYSTNYLISLLISSTLLDYYVGRAIWNANNARRKKILLSCSLAGNLGLLGFFKYVNFGIEQFNALGSHLGFSEMQLLEITLPIGISFYTFQTISYTVEIYRGKLTPSNSLKEFALFVAFFPQLVAGPILRAHEFLPQLRQKIDNLNFHGNLRQIILKNSNLKFGITMMAFGFLKKMFFADNIAPMVNYIFSDPTGFDSFSIVMGTIAFGIQIYCDFSGYSDIAIGAAMILGFKIPKNFNKPYFATSPSDFWKRWHISLSSWLRDYLYIPLGGNRKSSLGTYANLMIVMFLGGLWHGASWNFVIWGLLHGSYLVIQKLILKKFPQLHSLHFFKTKVGKIISIFIMQYFIFLAWIPFRVRDLDHALYSMEKFVFFDFQTSGILQLFSDNTIAIGLIILFIILHGISYKKSNIIERISNFDLKYWTIIITLILGAVVFFFDGNPEDFIYFRF